MSATGLYGWLLFLHVLAAMVWLGGLLALNVFGTRALRDGDGQAIARFVASLRAVGPFLLAPASAIVVIAGVWMTIDSPAWEAGQFWIWFAIALVGAAVVIGGAFLARSALGAERALAAGDRETAMRHLRRWSWGIRLIVVLLAVATWDMVFKPGI
jgi:uncharacterized membrane protein